MKKEILYSDIQWGEAPRWREGNLWFSDILGKKVKCVDLDGRLQQEIDVCGMPVGLGFCPNGDVLIVEGSTGLVKWEKETEQLSVAANLRELATGVNDMAVNSHGIAYIGCYGYDIRSCLPGMETPGWIAAVRPDGTVLKTAEGLQCPNGMVFTPDERQIVVADTFLKKLIAFDVQEDGRLTGFYTWTDLECGPDGIAMMRDGSIWAAIPDLHQVVHLEEGGKCREQLVLEDTPLACEIGGEKEELLFIVTVAAKGVEDELCNPIGLAKGNRSKVLVYHL